MLQSRRKMKERFFTICALALALVVSTVHTAEKPNIILVYVDDMGYGDASCLNPQEKFKTPNIDRLAKEGMNVHRRALLGHRLHALALRAAYWALLMAHHAQARGVEGGGARASSLLVV